MCSNARRMRTVQIFISDNKFHCLIGSKKRRAAHANIKIIIELICKHDYSPL